MKILHLEDNDNDAELISAALGEMDCQITRVETRETFVEALEQNDWDIILADYSLPGFDGISALELIAAKHLDLPVIFVTGALGEERAVETLKNGATDYILKDHLHRLGRAVIRAIRESESARAKKETEQNLRTSLREREVLLKEVHHRVNNNLQIICSLLRMQSRSLKDPLLVSTIEESLNRVQSMALIHAMFYNSSNLKEIDFAQYIRQLAAEVSSSYGVDPSRIRVSF
jgi:DNA-binding response OmpR family regulator